MLFAALCDVVLDWSLHAVWSLGGANARTSGVCIHYVVWFPGEGLVVSGGSPCVNCGSCAVRSACDSPFAPVVQALVSSR